MQTRIYIVRPTKADGQPRMVEAASQSQAIRHVVSGEYEAAVANTKQLASLMASGVKVESANPAATDAQEASV